MSTNQKYSAKLLANLSIHQKNLFLFCQKSDDVNVKLFSIYNLQLAVELILKAYLVSLDNQYSVESKLIDLGHKLINLKEKIFSHKRNKLKIEIDNLFKEYEFLSQNSNELRYPYVGKTIFINASFDGIIQFIEKVAKELT